MLMIHFRMNNIVETLLKMSIQNKTMKQPIAIYPYAIVNLLF